MPETPQILQLKIRILGISRMIWRRVLVPSTTMLRELHGIIQVAMGWEGIHLYQFDIRTGRLNCFCHCPWYENQQANDYAGSGCCWIGRLPR